MNTYIHGPYITNTRYACACDQPTWGRSARGPLGKMPPDPHSHLNTNHHFCRSPTAPPHRYPAGPFLPRRQPPPPTQTIGDTTGDQSAPPLAVAGILDDDVHGPVVDDVHQRPGVPLRRRRHDASLSGKESGKPNLQIVWSVRKCANSGCSQVRRRGSQDREVLWLCEKLCCVVPECLLPFNPGIHTHENSNL